MTTQPNNYAGNNGAGNNYADNNGAGNNYAECQTAQMPKSARCRTARNAERRNGGAAARDNGNGGAVARNGGNGALTARSDSVWAGAVASFGRVQWSRSGWRGGAVLAGAGAAVSG